MTFMNLSALLLADLTRHPCRLHDFFQCICWFEIARGVQGRASGAMRAVSAHLTMMGVFGDLERICLLNDCPVHKLWVLQCFALMDVHTFNRVACGLLSKRLNWLASDVATAAAVLVGVLLRVGGHSSH